MPRRRTPTPQPPTRRRAFGYLRVSTDEQERSGLSLDHQRHKVESYAFLRDLDLTDMITEVASARSVRTRDALAAMLGRLQPGDTFIVAKLDRLTRSVRDLGDLLDDFARREIALVSVGEHLDTSTAAGRLVINVMASVSQWEREVITERTREALDQRRRQGFKTSREAPYGFRADASGRVHPDKQEQRMLARIAELRGKGLSLRATAAALNAKGYRNRAGLSWKYTGILRVSRPSWGPFTVLAPKGAPTSGERSSV